MDPRELFYLVSRRWMALVLSGLVFAGLAWGWTYSSFEEGRHHAEIFVTMGAKLQSDAGVGAYASSQNENVIDQFTQTVQGWLATPGFLAKVEESLGQSVGMSVRKQEKQNLIVGMDLSPEVDPVQAAAVLLDVLEGEINAYNDVTNTSFVVALSSQTIFVATPGYERNVLMGMIFGLLIAFLFVLGREFFRREVSFGFQVSSALGDEPIMRLSRFSSGEDLNGLRAFLPEDVTFLEVGKTSLSRYKSRFEEMGSKWLRYPKDLNERVEGSVLIVAQLGVSEEDRLKELRILLGGEADYLLIV